MSAVARPARLLAALAVAALAAALGGCASLQPSGAGGDSPSVAELERRVVALQQQATVNELELRRLRQKVAELEERLDGAPVRSGSRSTAAEPARPPAPAPVAEAEPPRDLLASDVESEEIDLPPVAPPPAAPTSPPTGADAARPAPLVPASAAAQALYDQAYTLFHEKRYESAEAEFERFLELHPGSDLADNAQFWIGECRYARGDYDAALAAFTATVARYPEGNKVADALLKAGKTLEALGDRERARETYEEVRRRYPGSAAAALADERLAALE